MYQALLCKIYLCVLTDFHRMEEFNLMNLLLAATDANAQAQGTAAAGTLSMILMIIVWGVVIYFLIFRPQKKEQKRKQATINSLEVGANVLTTSGFYGVVIDVTDEDVIVEFGSNKNCRIPMKKAAIEQVELPEK